MLREARRDSALGDVLFDIRSGLGWSQRRMGEALHRSESWVSKVESGAHTPGLDEFFGHLSRQITQIAGASCAAIAERALWTDVSAVRTSQCEEAVVIRRVTDPGDPACMAVHDLLVRRFNAEDVPGRARLRRAASLPFMQLWISEDAPSSTPVSALLLHYRESALPLACIWYLVSDDAYPGFGNYSDALLRSLSVNAPAILPGCSGAVVEIAAHAVGNVRTRGTAVRGRRRLFRRLAEHLGWRAHEVNIPYLSPVMSGERWRGARSHRVALGLPLPLLLLLPPRAAAPEAEDVRTHVYDCLRAESIGEMEDVTYLEALERRALSYDTRTAEFARLRETYLEEGNAPHP